MLAALVGVVGVIVGALLAGVNAFAVERAKDRRRARASARLLESELWQIAGRARLLAAELREHDHRTDAWYRAAEALVELPSAELWLDHRDVLAETLPDTSWHAVAGAYQRVELLRSQTRDTVARVSSNATGALGIAIWSGSVVGYLVDGVKAGAKALAQLAGRSPEHSPGDELDRLMGVVSSRGTRYAVPEATDGDLDAIR